MPRCVLHRTCQIAMQVNGAALRCIIDTEMILSEQNQTLAEIHAVLHRLALSSILSSNKLARKLLVLVAA